MANTLKFGAGQWATKEGSTLAYNDENDNYKPLPFDFTRASSATVVNKAGLIETVGNAIPRIDFLGNTQGALKLEPQRTNLITYSSDFPRTYWTKNGASIQGDPSTQGSELVTNGDFATDSDWTKGTGWTISGGKANASATTGQLYQSTNTTTNTLYKIEYTISNYVSGSYNFLLRGTSTATFSGNGTFTVYITSGSGGNSNFIIDGVSSFTGSIDNVSVKEVQGFTSPDGTNNAYKLVEDNSNSIHRMYQTATVSASPNASISIFVKYNGRKFVLMRIADSTVGRWYDIENGVLGSAFQGTPNDSSIESVGNGWYRISISNTVSSVARLELWVSDTESTSAYQGDTTKGVYIYGSQLEVGSYSTSAISTSGSAVTRVADACNNGGNAAVFNNSEGVLYVEIASLSLQDDSERKINLSNNGTSYLRIQYGGTPNLIYCFVYINGVKVADIRKSLDTTNLNKVALRYSSLGYTVYINGIFVETDSFGGNFTSYPLVDLGFSEFKGKTKDIRYYDTALTDAELATLTTI